MPNPIFDSMQTSQRAQVPLGLQAAINQVKSAPDPNAAMMQMLNNEPNGQKVMDYITHNGGDARSAFYNMAAQMGVDPNSVLSLLR